MKVGEQVVNRRAELGLSRAAAAKLAGVDPKTLQSLEQDARWPHDTNRAKIERALQWAPGSLDAIRNGDEPTELASTPVTPPADKHNEDDDFNPFETDQSPEELREEMRRSTHLAEAFNRFLTGSLKPDPKAVQTRSLKELDSLRESIRLINSLHGPVRDLVMQQAREEFHAAALLLNEDNYEALVLRAYELLDEQYGTPSNDELTARRETAQADDAFDEDDILDRINSGEERFAAQEATEPLDEEWT